MPQRHDLEAGRSVCQCGLREIPRGSASVVVRCMVESVFFVKTSEFIPRECDHLVASSLSWLKVVACSNNSVRIILQWDSTVQSLIRHCQRWVSAHT